MTYTVINPDVFVAAFSGCLSGIISARPILSTSGTDYASETASAETFAETFDTLYNHPATITTLEQSDIEAVCEEYWSDKNPPATGTVGFFTPIVNTLIALVQKAQAVVGISAPGGLITIEDNGIVYVQKYGYKPDWNGVTGTDNTPAVLRAIAALPGQGGQLIFPTGAGLVRQVAGAPANTPMFETSSRVLIKGTNSGDLSVGSATTLVTDSDYPIFGWTNRSVVGIQDLTLLSVAAGPTSCGLRLSATPNSIFRNILVTGFRRGVDLLNASFLNTFEGCRILSNVDININGEANTNGLALWGCSFGGATSVGLRLVDSNSLTVVGGDCEGVTDIGIDIDATSPLDVLYNLVNVHFENNAAPTVAFIRVGHTARVRGGQIMCLFYASLGSQDPVLFENDSSGWSMFGGRAASGSPSSTFAASGEFSDAGTGGVRVRRDTTITGSAVSYFFAQKNDAGTWVDIAKLYAYLAANAAGAEGARLAVNGLIAGAEVPFFNVGLVAGVVGTGFNGSVVVVPQTYTVTNPVVNRSLDVTAATLAELRQVVGTLIADIQATGLART